MICNIAITCKFETLTLFSIYYSQISEGMELIINFITTIYPWC